MTPVDPARECLAVPGRAGGDEDADPAAPPASVGLPVAAHGLCLHVDARAHAWWCRGHRLTRV